MTILETGRLLFRAHTLEDLDPFCALEADPAVRRFVGGRPRTREEAEHRLRDRLLRPAPDRLGLWATIFKPDGCYIGYCGVYPLVGEAGPIPGEARSRSLWPRPAGDGAWPPRPRAFRVPRAPSAPDRGQCRGRQRGLRPGDREAGVCVVAARKINRRSFYRFEIRNPRAVP